MKRLLELVDDHDGAGQDGAGCGGGLRGSGRRGAAGSGGGVAVVGGPAPPRPRPDGLPYRVGEHRRTGLVRGGHDLPQLRYPPGQLPDRIGARHQLEHRTGPPPTRLPSVARPSPPSRAPPRTAGTSPAFSREDFPAPEAPTSITRPPVRPAARNCSTSASVLRSRPKNQRASCCRYEASPR